MKKWITSLFAATLISGCSTVPSEPTPHSEKYTFQVISIEIPFEAATDYIDKITSISVPDAEALMNHPKAIITEYPIVVAMVGESVTNDQTKAASFPEDYDIVDGKVVAIEKIIKLGYIVGVTVDKVENGAVSYHLYASHKELARFETFTTENDLEVKMPYFNVRAVDTHIIQQPKSLFTISGLVGEGSNGEKLSLMFCVKIIPPASEKEIPTSG